MDYATLTDAELQQVRQDSTSEADRRDMLAMTPGHVAVLARRYAAAGGGLADLHAAIDTADTEGA